MIYQTIEFGTTIHEKDKINKVRLVAPNEEIQQNMKDTLKDIVNSRCK